MGGAEWPNGLNVKSAANGLIMHVLLILMLERIFAITVPTFNFGIDYGYKIPTKPRQELNPEKLKQAISLVISIFVC